MAFISKFYLLFIYSLNLFMNKGIYGYKQLFSSHDISEFEFTKNVKKFGVIQLTVFYVCWCSIIILLHIIIHSYPLPLNKLNFLLLCFALLAGLMFTRFPKSMDMSVFIIHTNQPLNVKKRLIVFNALMATVMVMSLVLLLALPVLIVQLSYLGLKAFAFFGRFFFVLFIFGLLTDFVKYMFFYYQWNRHKHKHSWIHFVIYILIIASTPYLSRMITYYIDGFLLNFNQRERMKEFVDELSMSIRWDFYGQSLPLWFYCIGIIMVAILLISINRMSKLFMIENNRILSVKTTGNEMSYYFTLFTHFRRKYGLLNEHVVLVTVVSYLVYPYLVRFHRFDSLAVAVSVFLFITAFFILERNPEIILIFKRNHMPFVQTALTHSIYLFCQFILFKMVIYFMLERGNLSVSGLNLMTSTVQGLLLIFSVMTCYTYLIYRLDGIFETKFIYTVSEKALYVVLGINYVLTTVARAYVPLPHELVNLASPLITAAAIVFILEVGITLSRRKRKRGIHTVNS